MSEQTTTAVASQPSAGTAGTSVDTAPQGSAFSQRIAASLSKFNVGNEKSSQTSQLEKPVDVPENQLATDPTEQAPEENKSNKENVLTESALKQRLAREARKQEALTSQLTQATNQLNEYHDMLTQYEAANKTLLSELSYYKQLAQENSLMSEEQLNLRQYQMADQARNHMTKISQERQAQLQQQQRQQEIQNYVNSAKEVASQFEGMVSASELLEYAKVNPDWSFEELGQALYDRKMEAFSRRTGAVKQAPSVAPVAASVNTQQNSNALTGSFKDKINQILKTKNYL